MTTIHTETLKGPEMIKRVKELQAQGKFVWKLKAVGVATWEIEYYDEELEQGELI